MRGAHDDGEGKMDVRVASRQEGVSEGNTYYYSVRDYFNDCLREEGGVVQIIIFHQRRLVSS